MDTILIIGCGDIGRAVAKRAASFGMTLVGADPYVKESLAVAAGIRLMPIRDLLRRADFVSAHTPLNKETHHLIGEPEFKLMKPTAYLINTARGTVVNESALVAALQRQQIAVAAIDVYDPEPPRPGNPLLHMDNVIVTPHFCAMTAESLYNMGTMVAKGVLDVLEGQRPEYLVNPEIWDERRSSVE